MKNEASTTKSINRKRPWNRVNLGVYSVSSQGISHNMHICTYVSAVSMQPKRMMVALYEGTRTLDNVMQTGSMVLQLLSSHQYNMVNLLGKQSGHAIDKIGRLNKRQLLQEWNSFYVLKEALAVMELKTISHLNAGDHTIFVCDVIAYKNLNDGLPLTTQILHEKKIIRI